MSPPQRPILINAISDLRLALEAFRLTAQYEAIRAPGSVEPHIKVLRLAAELEQAAARAIT